MTDKTAFIGARILDGKQWRDDCALLVADGRCEGVTAKEDVPSDFRCEALGGGILTPGFVDLQVNGGGGVLLNEVPTLGGIRTICKAHKQFGTTGLLPTLITDTPEVTARAVEAGMEAEAAEVPGFLGLHLEGPHLSVEKKGAHSPDLIRKMTERDVITLCNAKKNLTNLLVTLAPESADDDQISALVAAGIRVSLGHSAATLGRTKSAFAAGVTSVTHLYNAMSPLTHREPGIVGAALNDPSIFCGLIADGHHVAPEAINIALRIKTGAGKLFLVTDAMSTIGTDQQAFRLNGRLIKRHNGRLTLEDGTLAGADLDMISAVRFMAEHTTCSTEEALLMASNYPAAYLGITDRHGTFAKGAYGNFIHMSKALEILSVFEFGSKVR